MTETPKYLESNQLVTDFYGYWPSFHDAEVHSISINRDAILFEDVSDVILELVVHCFQMTQTVKEDGYFELVKHSFVHFEFKEVDDVALAHFNHQNAIYELGFSGNQEGRFKVSIDGAHGLDGSFTAGKGRVISITPCDEEGRIEPVDSPKGFQPLVDRGRLSIKHESHRILCAKIFCDSCVGEPYAGQVSVDSA
ncbi:MAG: hypothetical protein HC904_17705 [Blastochloris sp.]|nr:hypothetical protein [Blastochloris sp.]